MNKETTPSESETTFALILTIMYHLKYAKSILVLIFHEYLNYFLQRTSSDLHQLEQKSEEQWADKLV